MSGPRDARASNCTCVHVDGAPRRHAGSRQAVVVATVAIAGLLLAVLGLPPELLAQDAGAVQPYGDFPVIGGRGVIWITAQVHLMFAAFVLGVPMFAVVVEAIGIFGGDKRYDKLAKEFTRLLLIAYSATAIWGAMLTFALSALYPVFWAYLTQIFGPSMILYASLFIVESFTLYLYYYGWDRWSEGKAKYGHFGLGILLNVWGTIVMFIANGWLTYMMSPPAEVTVDTAPDQVQLWSAIFNATWMPINIHRLLANVVFGGAIVGMYAAYRFLAAKTDEERAHYDWMGYIGNFIAIGALIVLPFAGYYLGREIYEFNQQMGITMMGGFMSWLWIIQAFLIGVLFLAGNYYLWTGMGRIPGAERFTPYIKYMLFVLVVGTIVWATPHTMIASRDEIAAMGGTHHPFLGVLGVMSAKNTAVNLMILTTFLSFMLYRRANKIPVVDWARSGTIAQGAALAIAAAVVIFYGVYGYFVTAIVRIGFSVYQVLAVLAAMVFVVILDILMLRGAKSRGEIRWGQMPARSQYALFILAVTFTWLMGLMGFARSGIRQHWHVYEVVRDTSSQAATPALGPAATMISVCVLIFLSLVALIFWLGGLAEKPAHKDRKDLVTAVPSPAPGPAGGPRPATGRPDMWRTNLTVGLIVLGTLAVYTAVANMIPQVESAVPEEITLGADARPEELVAAGEQVYGGAGGCTACHGLGTRAPDLLGVAGSVCTERRPDMSCKDYLHESLVDPGAFVVEGFQPIMPDMSRTLSDVEIWSLVAFLESQGGEVTVTSDDVVSSGGSGGGAPGAGGGAATGAAPAGGAEAGAAGGSTDAAALMQSLGCTACHAAAEGGPGVGPSVPAMAALEPDYIRRSILQPAADTAAGFEQFAGTMPPTFGDQLTAAQLEAIVDYLAGGGE